ncbi:MAG: flagellar basal body-associated FliL family protein [Desulfocurvibacter africanus]
MMPILLAVDASTSPDKTETSKPKAMLDPSSIQGQDQSRSNQKVELDLDDAPFLDEPEEEAAPQEFFAEAQAEELTIAAPKPENAFIKLLKDKKLRLLLLALLLLALLTLTTVKFILPVIELKEVAQVEVKPVPEEEVEEPAPPPPPTVPEVQEFVLGLEPFWVEKVDAKGQVHFLHLKFAFTSLSPALENEVKIKALLLRDAIYYYLKNKDFEFLADTKNIEALKADLVSVLNQYLGNDQLDTIYVEKYLVQ